MEQLNPNRWDLQFRTLTQEELTRFKDFYRFREGGIRNRGLSYEDLAALLREYPLGVFIGVAHIFEFKLPEAIAKVENSAQFGYEAPPWKKSGIYGRIAEPPDAQD